VKSTLVNKSRNEKHIAVSVERATSFSQRLLGLMGKPTMPNQHALWISNCPSIHTFFMRFPIDAIFVDKNLRVKAVYHSIQPWRVSRYVLGADSVFELKGGTLDETSVQVGDQLHVCT
jgi:uncharacterized membrane protein (UPF0127 family)